MRKNLYHIWGINFLPSGHCNGKRTLRFYQASVLGPYGDGGRVLSTLQQPSEKFK